MHLKMRNGNVAIKAIESNDVTSGGIYIPQTSKQGILRVGEIVEKGPGELIQGQFVECDLDKGTQVLFDSTRAEAFRIDNTDVYICNMVDVVAVVSAKHLSVVP